MNYIFATPIEIIELQNSNIINQEIELHINSINFKHIEDTDHGNIEISNGNLEENIIEILSLNSLRDSIIECANKYCDELSIYTDPEIKISSSWFFKTKTNGFGNKHAHKCLVAGVYYFKTNDSIGDLRFHNNDSNDIIRMFNGRYADLTPKDGMLVLFPGWLPHEITPNTSVNDRISIGFNLDV